MAAVPSFVSNSGSRSDRQGPLVSMTSFTFSRGKRMARQRRSIFSFVSPSAHVPSSSHTARVTDPQNLRYLFEKELQNSDVSGLRRMVLPKKAAEAYMPFLESKEGFIMTVGDYDGIHVWSFKYRYWPNNNSRMYVLENTGDFVKYHGLVPGDVVVMYQDVQTFNYVVQAKKFLEEVEYDDIIENGVNDEDIYNDITTNNVNDDQIFQDSYFEFDFPPVEEDAGAPKFIYDTTFSSESPLDFLGGTVNNYYSRLIPPENFGSVENMSLDEYFG
nr:fusca 3 [Paeonia rockii]